MTALLRTLNLFVERVYIFVCVKRGNVERHAWVQRQLFHRVSDGTDGITIHSVYALLTGWHFFLSLNR